MSATTLHPQTTFCSLRPKVEMTIRSGAAQTDHVQVETRGDHVILRGTVGSYAERDEVERLAWCVPGVCHVENNLFVETERRHAHK